MPRSATAGNERVRRFAGLSASALLLLLPLVASALPTADSLARLAARRYGLETFHTVEALHYTFHVKFGDKDIERSWVWYPKSDSVAYRGKDAAGLAVTAAWSRKNRISVESPAVKPLDKMFINDQYWLLFPFHLAWDKGLELSAALAAKDGKGGGGAPWMLTVRYPSEGGYTPGDAYDLRLDSTGRIERWIFRKGNSPEPTREALWSEPVPVGPLRLSLDRPGTEKGFHLWFTGVRAETALTAP